MTWQSIVFLVVAGAAFGYSGNRLFTLYRLMRAHVGKDERCSGVGARIRTFVVNVLGQKRVLQSRAAGVMHATIFWGFIVITIGTTEQFLTTIYQPANFHFIGRSAYRVLVFLQDFFTLGVLLACVYALYRRFVVRPPGVRLSLDANLILLLVIALMISIFLMNAFGILGFDYWFKGAMPFSGTIASLLGAVNPDENTSRALSLVFKWIHMLIVLGFLVYIPTSKHLHIIAAAPNTFLRTLGPKPMKPINFEDESVQQYGAAKVSDLTWKDALDYFSCTECGRCQNMCPAWNTEKPLSPMALIVDLKHNLYANKAGILNGRRDDVTHVIDERVTEDVIWACTTCRACEVACPVFIEHTDKIYDIRRNLVMMESRFPQEATLIFKNMETNATPWSFSAADRAAWADGLGITTMAESADVEYLYWVGCAGSYDDRSKKVSRAFSSIMKKAGIRFSILGSEEQCTGDPARRIGNEYLFQTLAKANIETLGRYNVKKIVTACPHCFNTLKNEYAQFGGNYEVLHHSQLIANLIAEGRVKPKSPEGQRITFHDSCYLGRWNGEYDAPRSIISSLPSAELVEMPANRRQGMCCGAGGGRMWMEEKIGKRVNVARTEQALQTGVPIIGTSCPFCMTMMTDGLKAKEATETVRVMDVAELVDQSAG